MPLGRFSPGSDGEGWVMQSFDAQISPAALAKILPFRDILENAFFGEDLYWKAESGVNGESEWTYYAFRRHGDGQCIAMIPSNELNEDVDLDDFQMRIMTGQYQPDMICLRCMTPLGS